MLVQARREKMVEMINQLPEEKLAIVEEILSKINKSNYPGIEDIYNEAVMRYHETLQKLAP